jgi:sRNA-binding protein
LSLLFYLPLFCEHRCFLYKYALKHKGSKRKRRESSATEEESAISGGDEETDNLDIKGPDKKPKKDIDTSAIQDKVEDIATCLTIGTEVSAKYKGAFCEAKISGICKEIKCRVTFNCGLGTRTISDDFIRSNEQANLRKGMTEIQGQ